MRTSQNRTAAPRLSPKDLFVRYIVMPLVMVIGLYGLIDYAVTGENGTTDHLAPLGTGPVLVR